MRVFLLTDQITFAIVVGIFLVIGAVLFVVANVLGVAVESETKKSRNALNEWRSKLLDMIATHRDVYVGVSADQFIDFHRDFLRGCINHNINNGLDRYAAIEDAIIFSDPIVKAYSETVTAAEYVEEYAGAVSNYLRETLRLEALEEERQELLKGGLSNP